MYKIILSAIVSFCFTTAIQAQTNHFADYASSGSTTWVISKFLISPSGEDKKALFNNYSFQFSRTDTTTVLVIDNTGSKPPRKGFWNQQDKFFDILLPTDPYDIPYYKIALLLNKTSLEEVSVTSSLAKFKTPDVMGQAVIELTRNN